MVRNYTKILNIKSLNLNSNQSSYLIIKRYSLKDFRLNISLSKGYRILSKKSKGEFMTTEGILSQKKSK